MSMSRPWVALLIVASLICQAQAEWSVELSRDSTPYVRFDGSRALRFQYAAWAADWKYAGAKSSMWKPHDGVYPFNGASEGLDVTWKGTAEWKDNSLVYDWNFNCTKSSTGNMGAVLAADTRLDPNVFNTDPVPKATVNADGKGWSWTPLPGQTVTVNFEGAPAKSAFEPGSRTSIRSWLLGGTIREGQSQMRMTMTFPPGTKFNGMPAARYEELDPEKWLPDTMSWTASPIDFSSLNDKPAGSHGFVKAEGDHFVFADGTPVKFWGCNVAAYALFNATDAAIEQQAKRIAALGYNLVRIHHHDSATWAPSVFAAGPDTQHLDAGQLDRIDYWVKCLKDNGVYVWIDLHVGRPFRDGDNIPAANELPPVKNGHSGIGFNYVDDRITQLMKDFAKQYLDRKNSYTGLKYTEEPAVMGVLITNENDITDHFGISFLPDKKVPVHQATFEALRDKIISARGLDASKAWQTWMSGQSKVVLNEIQYQWAKDFVDYLHQMGVKVPIATTNTWGSNPLYSLPALTGGDMIDVHTYGTAEALSGNPRADANLSTWIAAAQVLGKPVTVTEWNTPFPSRDRFTMPLYIAAEASLQGWDAPMIFGYQQAPLKNPGNLSTWTTANDPEITALMPAAAMMFRRGDVAMAKTTAVLNLPIEKLLYDSISPNSSRAIRTVAEQHRLTIAMPQTPLLPWLQATPAPPEGAIMITDPAADMLPAGATTIGSDTGELSRDWIAGTFTINSPRSQAAMGWIGGQTVALGDVTFKITTSKATVVVTALDDQPIATSKKMLLTVVAQAEFSKKNNNAIFSEPVAGTVSFKSPVTTAVALTPQGGVGDALKVTAGAVQLPTDAKTHWFLLTR